MKKNEIKKLLEQYCNEEMEKKGCVLWAAREYSLKRAKNEGLILDYHLTHISGSLYYEFNKRDNAFTFGTAVGFDNMFKVYLEV